MLVRWALLIWVFLLVIVWGVVPGRLHRDSWDRSDWPGGSRRG